MGDRGTFHCIFCNASISSLSDTIYKKHFVEEHKIISFDTSILVLITVQRSPRLLRNVLLNLTDSGTQTQSGWDTKDNHDSMIGLDEYGSLSDCERDVEDGGEQLEDYEASFQTYSSGVSDRSSDLKRRRSWRERSSSLHRRSRESDDKRLRSSSGTSSVGRRTTSSRSSEQLRTSLDFSSDPDASGSGSSIACKRNSYYVSDDLDKTGSDICCESERNGFDDDSSELDRTGSECSRTGSSSGASRKGKVNKTCEKCRAEFDQIFDYESHLVSCYNKTHRSTVKPISYRSIINPTLVKEISTPPKEEALTKLNTSTKAENLMQVTADNGQQLIADNDAKLTSGNLLLSQCFFECKLCNHKITKWNKTEHLLDKHQYQLSDYTAKYGDTVLNKVYSCLICDMEMLWMRSTISRHTQKKHGISLADYESLYRDAILAQVQKSDQKYMCEMCDKKFTVKRNLRRHIKRVHNPVELPNTNKVSTEEGEYLKKTSKKIGSEWYNRFGYQCSKCKARFSYKGNLHVHIKKVHKIGIEEFYQEQGPLEAVETFVCKICNSSMSWTAESIRNHLDSKHCLSLENYGNIYIDNTSSTKKVDKSMKIFVQRHSSPVKSVMVDLPRLDKSVISHLCQELEEKEPPDYASLSKQDLGKCVNSAIEDLFSLSPVKQGGRRREAEDDILMRPYRCPTCLFRCSDKEALKVHTQDLHTLMETVRCCGLVITTRWNLFLHLDSVHPESHLLLLHNFTPDQRQRLRANIKTTSRLVNLKTGFKEKVPTDSAEENVTESEFYSKFSGPNCNDEDGSSHSRYRPASQYRHKTIKLKFVGKGPSIFTLGRRSDVDLSCKALPYYRDFFYLMTEDQVGSHETVDRDEPEDGDPSENIDDLLDGDVSDDNAETESNPRDGVETKERDYLGLDSPEDILDSDPFLELEEDRFEFNMDDVVYEDNDIDIVSPHLIWANRSTYECKVCLRFSVNDQNIFLKHLKEHQIPGVRAYRSRYGDPFSDLRTVNCRICNGMMIHDYSKIYYHLKKLHKNLSVQGYFEEYIVKQQLLGQEEDRVLPMEQDRVHSIDQDSGHPMEQDSENENDEKREVYDYKSWVNQCRIDCQHSGCTFQTMNSMKFRLHTLSEHSQLFEQYCQIFKLERQYAWTLVKYATCQLCNDAIVHSQYSVDHHMTHAHGISGFTYYSQYIVQEDADIMEDAELVGDLTGASGVAVNIQQLVKDEFIN